MEMQAHLPRISYHLGKTISFLNAYFFLIPLPVVAKKTVGKKKCLSLIKISDPYTCISTKKIENIKFEETKKEMII